MNYSGFFVFFGNVDSSKGGASCNLSSHGSYRLELLQLDGFYHKLANL